MKFSIPAEPYDLRGLVWLLNAGRTGFFLSIEYSIVAVSEGIFPRVHADPDSKASRC